MNTFISWKAKGLFIFILNHPEIFKKIHTNKDKFLLEHGKEGPDALRSGIDELVNNKLLHKKIYRNDGPGRNYVIGSIWNLIGEKR
jgi:hypothetical protein